MVKTLADLVSDVVTLVSTHILSLKQWHYLKVEPDSADAEEFEWYSPEWLKTTALEFALANLKQGLGRSSDIFIN